MVTLKKAIYAALAITAFTAFPLVQAGLQPALAHAAGHSARPATGPACADGNTPTGSVTIGTAAPGPLTFPTGCNTNGTTGPACTGPVVGVYGASALQSYIIQAAKDYCVSQLLGINGFSVTPPSNAIDVELLTGGDACPGDQWAANNPSQQVLGTTTVFPTTCAALISPYNPSSVTSTQIGVNVDESFSYCQGALVVQGGTPSVTSGFCQGTGDANNDATMCAPNDESLVNAVQLWSGGLGNYAPIGGCNTGTKVQQRKPDAGDKITWCANILGNPSLCNNTAPQPVASTQTVMFNDVCGNRFTGTGPLDGPNTIGYATRAALVVDPRASSGTVVPLEDCGLVTLGGNSGWNNNCDPTQLTQGHSQPYSAPNNAETPPQTECKGDLQVIFDNYVPWGYAQLATNNTVTSGYAHDFVNWVINHENVASASGVTPFISLEQAQGFMRTCQMNFQRTVDAGPVSGVTPTC